MFAFLSALHAPRANAEAHCCMLQAYRAYRVLQIDLVISLLHDAGTLIEWEHKATRDLKPQQVGQELRRLHFDGLVPTFPAQGSNDLFKKKKKKKKTRPALGWAYASPPGCGHELEYSPPGTAPCTCLGNPGRAKRDGCVFELRAPFSANEKETSIFGVPPYFGTYP